MWTGTEVAALTPDEAFLPAVLDAEAALARAQARLGLVLPEAAAAVTAAARAGGSTWPRSRAGPGHRQR